MLKFIIAIVGILVAVRLILFAVGIALGILWNMLLLAVICAALYYGYKLYKEKL